MATDKGVKKGPQKEEKPSSVVESCIGEGCKTKVSLFGFCAEHYDQFKFGLINKKGKPVPDYEKKFDHYQAYKQSLGVRKVA
jgi:hypothetical protein